MPIPSFSSRFPFSACASTRLAPAAIAPACRSPRRTRGALAGVIALMVASTTVFAQPAFTAAVPDDAVAGTVLAPAGPGGASGVPATADASGASDASGVFAADDAPAVPVAAASDAASTTEPLGDEAFAARAREHDAAQKLLDARTARMNYAYAVKQHDCYARFFVNHCLAGARDVMREEKGRIRTEQLALSAERRADRARQRDTRTEEKRAQTVADAPQRAANEERNRAAFAAKQRQHDLDAAKRGQDGAEQRQRAANAAAYRQKQAAHQQALDQASRNAETDAAKRAENVRRYEQKQKDAADRQRELDARRRKAQERADKSAAPASAPASQARP